MNLLFLKQYLPFKVDDENKEGKTQKGDRCVERVDGGEHGDDFSDVKSPEDVDEEDNTSNRKKFFPIHRCATWGMGMLVFVDFVSFRFMSYRCF